MYARQFQSVLGQANAMKTTFVTTWISLYFPSILEAANPRNFALGDGHSSCPASNSSTRTAWPGGWLSQRQRTKPPDWRPAVDIRQKANIILS
jgi:hypothetical protein